MFSFECVLYYWLKKMIKFDVLNFIKKRTDFILNTAFEITFVSPVCLSSVMFWFYSSIRFKTLQTSTLVSEYNVTALMHELMTGEMYTPPQSDDKKEAKKGKATLEELAEEEEEEEVEETEKNGKEIQQGGNTKKDFVCQAQGKSSSLQFRPNIRQRAKHGVPRVPPSLKVNGSHLFVNHFYSFKMAHASYDPVHVQLGNLRKDDVDDSENVILKFDYALLQSFLDYFKRLGGHADSIFAGYVKCPGVKVHFLSVNCVPDLSKKSKYSKLFDVIYFSNRYVTQ